MTAVLEPATRSGPKGVFVSYRRADAEEEARYLSDTLGPRVGPDRVFIDTVSLAPGVLMRVAGLAESRDRPDLALSLLAASDRMSGGDGDLDDDEIAAAHWFLTADGIGRREVARAMLSREDAEVAWQRGLGTDVEALPALIEEALCAP